MDMHPELLLAARVALGLTRSELARRAGIGERTLSDLEGGRPSSVETYLLVRRALEDIGVIFQPSTLGLGPGLRLPESWVGSDLVTPRRTRRGMRKDTVSRNSAD